ncbi:glycosyltransferase family 2 protein [Desulfosarcina cetonica]|uniref:glycosyltransferase family 2 protein n=1 Tax=Desulfosarcina cetonica TaxID=90730 RepID=UPI001FEDDD39|nr:glycosyltransferase family 2 protein [Desulfosarcina cetonica]
MSPEVSLIIPVYNEADSIGSLLLEIKERYPGFELIVVDDGSTDDTVQVADKAGATVFSHPYNIGNGAAVKTGIRMAKGDILVFMDGDGQHRPGDIGRMLELFPKYDMVVGARTRGGRPLLAVRSAIKFITGWLPM